MKSILVILFSLCLVQAISAAYVGQAFAGIYHDSRFGGQAFICTESDLPDFSSSLDFEPENGLQGSASGRVYFADYDLEQADSGIISGTYYEASVYPSEGTFWLEQDPASGDLSGWYKTGKDKYGWPWKLTKVSVNTPTITQCLYTYKNVTQSVVGNWAGFGSASTVQICNPKSDNGEGTQFNAAGNWTSYVEGYIGDEFNHVLVGRNYLRGEQPDTCSSFGNGLYKVVGDGTQLVGYINHYPVQPGPLQIVSAIYVGEGDSSKCDDGDSLPKNCEPKKQVGLPIKNPLRSSAASLGVSIFFVALVAFFAQLF